MKIATFAVNARISYGIVTDDGVVDAGSRLGDRFPDLRSLLTAGQLNELQNLGASTPPDFPLPDVRLLKPIPNPGKILCVGVNYPERAAEYKDNSEQPRYPSIFVRFPGSLVAHEEPILRPPESKQLDYEGEVALVIGRRARRITEENALSCVAGYTICNEGTIRDWLRHGKFNVTPGKNFEASGSLGPWIVTADEIGTHPPRITTRVNGELRQDRYDRPDDLLDALPDFIHFALLHAGTRRHYRYRDAGWGWRSIDPPRYLVPGDTIEVEVTRIGTLRNRVIDERVAPQ